MSYATVLFISELADASTHRDLEDHTVNPDSQANTHNHIHAGPGVAIHPGGLEAQVMVESMTINALDGIGPAVQVTKTLRLAIFSEGLLNPCTQCWHAPP